jgi:hypothetical protein
MHISTAYQPFYHPWVDQAGYKRPKSLPNWDEICKDLSSLTNLQSLTFDILADDPYFDRSGFEVDDPTVLVAILEPLLAVRASKMEVELNLQLSRTTLNYLNHLGPVGYEIKFRERPFNELFKRVPLAEYVELERMEE